MAVAALIEGGQRLHLQHGPIDLLISADGPGYARACAFAAASARFDGLLEQLAAELPLLRAPVTAGSPVPAGPVARRMHAACLPHSRQRFITPMAAVAGSVADEIAAAIRASADLTRLVVNNGGDIAFDAAPGQMLQAVIATPAGRVLGQVHLPGGGPVRGMATSGRGGRSFSLGIADSVTVLAESAALADAAATMIGNAVDLPGHPAIRRTPARDLFPDSDLGARLVVTGLGALDAAEIAQALDHGLEHATALQRAGLIVAAALYLGADHRVTGAWPGQLTRP